MKTNIIEENANEMKIEFVDEDHTVPNLTKSILVDDDRVEITSYDIKHPDLSDPVLHVKVDEGSNPREVIKEVLNSSLKNLKELSKEIEDF